jgi:hypothetical protein
MLQNLFSRIMQTVTKERNHIVKETDIPNVVSIALTNIYINTYIYIYIYIYVYT